MATGNHHLAVWLVTEINSSTGLVSNLKPANLSHYLHHLSIIPSKSTHHTSANDTHLNLQTETLSLLPPPDDDQESERVGPRQRSSFVIFVTLPQHGFQRSADIQSRSPPHSVSVYTSAKTDHSSSCVNLCTTKLYNCPSEHLQPTHKHTHRHGQLLLTPLPGSGFHQTTPGTAPSITEQ